ncbi:MAG: outer membrane protein assembly factor BamD [Bacteroidetes bacterium]|jgi:outer membrane protein assembly factor BamD|nr:outer membrane protein assembly factor BamD [Bacteroidota bacterium]
MKNQVVFILFICVLIIGTGCKSGFEKIRASGDTELIYKKAFEYFETEEYQRSQTLFELIIPAYRGKAELEDIYYTYAYTYYNLGRYILANYYFKNFTTTFPNSEKKQDASFMAAYSNYELSPTYRLDQTYTNKAIDEFQIFVNTYPSSEKVAECNRLIDQMRLKLEKKTFEEAGLYFDLRQYQASTATFENLLKDFPETTKAEQVRYMMAKSAFLLAQNSIYEKQEERYKQVVSYSNDFLKKFKDSDNYKEVKSFYNNSIKRLKELTNGRYQDQSSRVGS